ncbi:MAG: sigma 54-interacting transcriptional regulator [Bacillota bacterium]
MTLGPESNQPPGRAQGSTTDLRSLTAEEFENILNAIEDEVYITDGQGYTIYANRTCERHYGVPVSDLLGKHVLELQEQGVYWPAVTPLVLQTKRPVTIEQNTMIGRKLVITGVPVFDPSGSIKMVVCTSRDVTELVRLQQQIQAQQQLLERYAAEVAEKNAPEGLVYNSPAMRDAVDLARIAARVDTTVLITGESGVGKDLIARAIHSLSRRRHHPFVKINCSAIPESLLESELFGYVAGAFTGARREGKPGLLAAANKGTLFLDEVGDMPLSLQPKILQVIEEKRFFPVGSSNQKQADVRIIAATNQNLDQLMREGRFREDLYYRLNVLTVWIPPLRQRREDILPLIYHFLNKCNEEFGLRRQLSPGAVECLLAYTWPGNVRELRNVMERLVLTARADLIEEDDLPDNIRTSVRTIDIARQDSMSLQQAKILLEEEMIRQAYATFKSSYKVARALGISQSAAIRKIRKYVFHDAASAASKANAPSHLALPLPELGRGAEQ